MSRPLCIGDGEVDEERWNPDEPPHPVLPVSRLIRHGSQERG